MGERMRGRKSARFARLFQLSRELFCKCPFGGVKSAEQGTIDSTDAVTQFASSICQRPHTSLGNRSEHLDLMETAP